MKIQLSKRSSEKLSDDLKYILFRQEQKLASSGWLSLSPKYCEEASSRIDTENQRGCTRLALNSTPIPQDFKLLRRCAEVKPKFAFFQEQRERFAIDSVVFSQDAFCLIPKILNAVDVVLMVYKRFGMVDAVMDKTAHVQLVVAAQTIGINNTVRHDFLFDDRE